MVTTGINHSAVPIANTTFGARCLLIVSHALITFLPADVNRGVSATAELPRVGQESKGRPHCPVKLSLCLS